MSEMAAQNRVLVTAGAAGIGRAIARAFADDGAKVWVTDIDPDALTDCPRDWRRDRVDVGDPAAMAALFERIAGDWGGLDVLCANAGVAGPIAAIEDQSFDGFRDCLTTNIVGVFLAIKGALPMMKCAGHGVILLTSSTAGLFGFPYRAPYVASKWALHGLMKTVAIEAGPHGIRVNAIAPGCVEGPRIDGVIAREAEARQTTPDAIRTAYMSGASLRTFVTADDVARMAVFLASERAAKVSGQVIAVDGHTEIQIRD